jgi:hypothetical protein
MAKLDTNLMAKKTLPDFQNGIMQLINDSLKDGVPMEGIIFTLDIRHSEITNTFLSIIREQNMRQLAASIAEKKTIITPK